MVKVAQTSWGMTCSFPSPAWLCVTGPWRATFQPEKGPVTTLTVTADAGPQQPMDGQSEAMMVDLLNKLCAPGDISKFVGTVGALTVAGVSVPSETITGCRLSGGRRVPRALPDYHWVTADVVASPTPTPTPTPKPIPTPTPAPTPAPTATLGSPPSPGQSAGSTGAPSPGASSQASPGASPAPASADPGASASPSGSTPVEGASPGPSETPGPTLATPASGPSASPANSPGGSVTGPPGRQAEPPPGNGILGWVDSVPAAKEVRTDVGSAWVTLAAILALLFAMGFMGELFNNTLESNYDRIRAWWDASIPGRLLRSLAVRLGGGD